MNKNWAAISSLFEIFHLITVISRFTIFSENFLACLHISFYLAWLAMNCSEVEFNVIALNLKLWRVSSWHCRAVYVSATCSLISVLLSYVYEWSMPSTAHAIYCYSIQIWDLHTSSMCGGGMRDCGSIHY